MDSTKTRNDSCQNAVKNVNTMNATNPMGRTWCCVRRNTHGSRISQQNQTSVLSSRSRKRVSWGKATLSVLSQAPCLASQLFHFPSKSSPLAPFLHSVDEQHAIPIIIKCIFSIKRIYAWRKPQERKCVAVGYVHTKDVILMTIIFHVEPICHS